VSDLVHSLDALDELLGVAHLVIVASLEALSLCIEDLLASHDASPLTFPLLEAPIENSNLGVAEVLHEDEEPWRGENPVCVVADHGGVHRYLEPLHGLNEHFERGHRVGELNARVDHGILVVEDCIECDPLFKVPLEVILLLAWEIGGGVDQLDLLTLVEQGLELLSLNQDLGSRKSGGVSSNHSS